MNLDQKIRLVKMTKLRWPCFKYRQLGISNQIVNDSDFKDNKFGRRNLSDSKSEVQIGIQLKPDFDENWILIIFLNGQFFTFFI